MIYMRLITREQAETIIREADYLIRFAVGKSDAAMSETIQAVFQGQPYDTGAMLRTICAIFDLAKIPYTFAKVPA